MDVPHTVPFVQGDQLHKTASRLQAAWSKVGAQVGKAERTLRAAGDDSSLATPNL